MKHVYISLIVILTFGCSNGSVSGSPNSERNVNIDNRIVDPLQEMAYIKIAEQKLESAQVPYDKRKRLIEYTDTEVVISYLVPPNTRGGVFKVSIDKRTGKVLKTVIGR